MGFISSFSASVCSSKLSHYSPVFAERGVTLSKLQNLVKKLPIQK
jgi:hypothetical protein